MENITAATAIATPPLARYRVNANICMGDDIYKYKQFVVRADSAAAARAALSNDWNIDSVRKMARAERE